MGSFSKPVDPPDQACSSVVECTVSNPDPMAVVLLLAFAGVVLVFLAFAVAHISTARSLLEEERARIADEAEAFASFGRRVAAVDVPDQPRADGGPTATKTLETPGGDGIDAVREAYRDTVMSVPHYEVEYDESLARNMHHEFGADVAGAVERGGSLTPQLQATLVDRSCTAHDQRVSLLRQFETEDEALDAADRTLQRCRRSADRITDAPLERYTYDELFAEWRLIDDRQTAADAVLAERQETVQDRDRANGTSGDEPSFEEYLYGPMEVTYPVLAAGTAVAERLGDARVRVSRALASRS